MREVRGSAAQGDSATPEATGSPSDPRLSAVEHQQIVECLVVRDVRPPDMGPRDGSITGRV